MLITVYRFVEFKLDKGSCQAISFRLPGVDQTNMRDFPKLPLQKECCE